jgi:hypothetical protein
MTSYSPFYHIKPSKCLVFSVCPACYHPSPVSCVTFLSLIIFKIIPHSMTLLIAFLLQVIVLYFILHCFSSLTYCLITYPFPSSHIPSPRIRHTCRLHPSHSIKDIPPYLSITRSSPPLILSCISLCLSSELSSRILVTLFILVFISCPHLHQNIDFCLYLIPLLLPITPQTTPLSPI